MEDTLRIAREELERAQSRHKVYCDRRSKKRAFAEGDQVHILLPTDSSKLLMRSVHDREKGRRPRLSGER